MDKLISQKEAVELVRKMMDIDGFRDGDAVSRRAVIAVLESMRGIPANLDIRNYEDDIK